MILQKTYRFEAAHRLPRVGPDHPCGRVHGHSYRIVLVCEGTVDPAMGWVFDFAELTRAWQPLHQRLDHHLLNEVEGLENPTSENLAMWIACHLAPAVAKLADGARLARVEVSETDTSTAKVDVPDDFLGYGFFPTDLSEIAGA
jgi:6-pyruvoyltetrahydropterin/6-carboxytetrahydropterin synthase